MLSVIGVAAVAMSMGFLMPEIPNFNLQNVAINEETFVTPINTANVDIEVTKTEVLTRGKSVFLNLIDACSFHTPDAGLGAGSTIICKLTDKDGDVVAEGKLLLPNGLTASSRTLIVIGQTASPFANEIQNIDDIKVIVLGTDPTLD